MEENKTQAPPIAPEPEIGGLPPRKPFPTLGDLFAMLGIVLGAQVVLGVVMMVLAALMGDGPEVLTEDPQRLGGIMAIVYFCSMGLSLWGVVLYRNRRGGSGPIADFSTKGLNPVLLVWAFVLLLAVGVVLEPLFELLPAPSNTGMGRGLWTAVMLVVMAPVFEELICRGVVLGSLRTRYGVLTAWLGSSLFFAVLHLQPVLVINAFVVGLILGFIYLKTNSLWAVIILHAMNNAMAFAVMNTRFEQMNISELVGSRTLYVTLYVVAVVVAALSGYMTWRSLKQLNEAEKNRAEA